MDTFEEVRTVTADGRLVVPWIVQRALGLDHGGPVRFHVDNGVVTLIGVDRPRPETSDAAPEGRTPARTDIRTALAAELKTLLAAAERDRAKETVSP